MSTYTDAVEHNLKDLDAVSIGACDECGDCSEAGHEEPSFSYLHCGICGRSLGGDRYIWHWLDENGALMHEDDACTDCVLYLANGDEPDGE